MVLPPKAALNMLPLSLPACEPPNLPDSGFFDEKAAGEYLIVNSIPLEEGLAVVITDSTAPIGIEERRFTGTVPQLVSTAFE